jgi:hypothetical protein
MAPPMAAVSPPLAPAPMGAALRSGSRGRDHHDSVGGPCGMPGCSPRLRPSPSRVVPQLEEGIAHCGLRPLVFRAWLVARQLLAGCGLYGLLVPARSSAAVGSDRSADPAPERGSGEGGVRDSGRARSTFSLGALRIFAEGDDGELELGDGGFTDWTAKLTQSKEERCLVSCLATERVASLARSAEGDSHGSAPGITAP